MSTANRMIELLLVAILTAGGCAPPSDAQAEDEAALANPNPDCTLVVPADPLSANGLASPYELVATNPRKGGCHETNKVQSAFVQGAILDPATGQIQIYNPLVIDRGTSPAIAPTVPTLPDNAVVALWFGFNGTNLTLASADGR